MYAQFFAGMRWSALPVFALVLFLTTFVVVVVRTLLPARRTELGRLARLPLEGDGDTRAREEGRPS